MTECILHEGCTSNSGYGLEWYDGKRNKTWGHI